jgi:hypothetical protein
MLHFGIATHGPEVGTSAYSTQTVIFAGINNFTAVLARETDCESIAHGCKFRAFCLYTFGYLTLEKSGIADSETVRSAAGRRKELSELVGMRPYKYCGLFHYLETQWFCPYEHE